MKKPLKTSMPKAAAKGGPPTKEKAKAVKGGTGVNMPARKESVPQTVAKVTFGQPKPAQKL